MKAPSRKSFTLAGLLIVTTWCAAVFSIGRIVGMWSVTFFMLGMLPVPTYLLLIRRSFQRTETDNSLRVRLINIFLVAGLLAASLMSLTFLGIACEMTEQHLNRQKFLKTSS